MGLSFILHKKQITNMIQKRECGLLMERKELSIEEYFQDASIYRDISGCVDGAFYHISGVIQQKKSRTSLYAAVALYYIDNDDGNKINSMPETMEIGTETMKVKKQRKYQFIGFS